MVTKEQNWALSGKLPDLLVWWVYERDREDRKTERQRDTGCGMSEAGKARTCCSRKQPEAVSQDPCIYVTYLKVENDQGHLPCFWSPHLDLCLCSETATQVFPPSHSLSLSSGRKSLFLPLGSPQDTVSKTQVQQHFPTTPSTPRERTCDMCFSAGHLHEALLDPRRTKWQPPFRKLATNLTQ